MALSNLRVFFDGLEEAKPGMPCYDTAQPWFAHVTVVNANSPPGAAPALRAMDPKQPTAAAGPFGVVFEVFVGATAALGTQHVSTYQLDGLDAYPGSNDCVVGFSMQLPKTISHQDFGLKHGFRFTADLYGHVAETNEGDNVYLWDKAQQPMLAPVWKEGDPSPFTDLKFVDFKGVPGSERQLDVLVRNQGAETSLQLELRLEIMGAPTPDSPTGSVLETVRANSTAIPAGGQTWIRFKAKAAFVHALAGLSPRELKRWARSGSRRFRQVQSVRGGLRGAPSFQRYLVVEKSFDFVPLKPFVITLINDVRSEKVAFGEPSLKQQTGRQGGGIAVPEK